MQNGKRRFSHFTAVASREGQEYDEAEKEIKEAEDDGDDVDESEDFLNDAEREIKRAEAALDDEDWDANLLRWKLMLRNEDMRNTWHVLANTYPEELQSTINSILDGADKRNNA